MITDFIFKLDGQPVQSFSCSYSQVKGEAAVVSISTLVPGEGFVMRGEGELIFVHDNGAQETVGKGKVSGFPVGMAGDEISVDLICRAEDHDARVDLAYASLLPIWQPEKELVSDGTKRRAEGWVPFFVHTHPVSHAVSMVHINGNTANPVHVLKGEGAGVGQSFVFSISPSITDEPIKELIVESVAEWTQVAARVIDYGEEAIGTLSTATPEEYEASVDNISLNSGGNYVFVGSAVKPRFNSSTSYPVAVRKAYVDARTSIAHPVIYENLTVSNYLSPDVDILTSITQTRKERARVKFVMDHGSFGGVVQTEEYQLSDPEERFKGSYSYPVAGGGRGFARIDTYPDSIHYKDLQGTTGDREAWIPQGILNRSFTQIVDASYCVTLRVETTADKAASMKIGDLCRIEDVRLPGGSATGRVSLVSVVLDETATGVIEIQCSTCSSSSYSIIPPADEDLIVMDAAQSAPVQTIQLQHLYASNANFFLEGDAEHTNGRWEPYDEDAEDLGLTSQHEIVAEINATNATGIPPVINPATQAVPEIYDIRSRLNEFLPPTSLSITLRDVGEVEDLAEHIVEINDIEILVKGGVS